MCNWRRRRDSNSRMVSHRRFSRPLPSAARPPLRNAEHYKHHSSQCKVFIRPIAANLPITLSIGLFIQHVG